MSPLLPLLLGACAGVINNDKLMNGILSQYRALDLTNEKGFLCGKLLADLGADVIKIERPKGDPSRNLGPFYRDERNPEKSLIWWALNTSKRGITLDLVTQDGRKAFLALAEKSDFIIESFQPGHLAKFGLHITVRGI